MNYIVNYIRVRNVNNQPPNLNKLPVTRRSYDTETTALPGVAMLLAKHRGHCAEAGMPASTLSSRFCTVQVLEGPKNLSSLQNSEVSAFGG